ncbi:hypothetical protein SteCoe_25879 [Stentor coeruleus]|uniref:Uncharacterized protein n=1 Tax=Stentor coeruleus TaxID=5963 RepID=A0A1R2BE69_9CILI|nr:hypothetical protein SteCoe_25879 [Stentor coeruleus]
MEMNMPKRVQWIPPDYTFGTAYSRIEANTKQQSSQNLKEKSFSFQKMPKRLPSIEIANITQSDSNYCKVSLVEFLKKRDKKYCTVFNYSKSTTMSNSGGKFHMKRIIIA